MKALTFKTAEDAECTIINDGLRKRDLPTAKCV